MIFKLKIEMGSAGAKDADDIAALLMEMMPRVAAKVGEDGEFGLVRDEEGKKVGRWDFSDNDPGEFVIGEADTTGGTSGCRHAQQYYYDEDGDTLYQCSRERGHSGVHACGNGREIVAVWQDTYRN